MPEEFEQETAQGFDVGRVLDIVRRRHLQFLLPLFVGWLVVWGSSWFLQARYKSATVILVEAPAMPEKYVAPNINADLQARLQSISQQILSRTRLLIINELNLYSGKNNRALSPDDKVEHMKKDIDIQLVHDREGAIQAFTISYS